MTFIEMNLGKVNVTVFLVLILAKYAGFKIYKIVR